MKHNWQNNSNVLLKVHIVLNKIKQYSIDILYYVMEIDRFDLDSNHKLEFDSLFAKISINLDEWVASGVSQSIMFAYMNNYEKENLGEFFKI